MKKLFKVCILIILNTFFLSSCESENIDPYLSYKADFSPTLVGAVENFTKEIAEKYGLRVFEKPRRNMRVLSNGKEAFFIALYDGDIPIVIITSVGVSNILHLSFFDDGQFTKPQLDALANDINNGLKEKFSIIMKRK